MHGIILAELSRYADARLGAGKWDDVLVAAGMPGETFLATTVYPDEVVTRIIEAVCELSGQSREAILEDFGVFVAPDLMRVYAAFVKPEWGTLDLIEHTEQAIHKAVRLRDPGADPPELESKRTAENEVLVVYGSERRMCSLAKGIIKGVAAHFEDRVHVSEEACMHHGASACRIRVETLP